MNSSLPLVSVVTPVYNGERFLGECIESVLAQTYQHWEYVILNNCSTDRTLTIAQGYASRDPRIKIHNTETLLPVIANHNRVFSLIDEQSAYCKILQADDFLLPECLQRMVELALSHPAIGVISAYSLSGRQVRCDGLPYTSQVMSGREICRLTLLGETYPFWSPSSVMVRSDLMRARKPFYTEAYIHSDVEAMYEVLQSCDFGFVHQVLTYIRRHQKSVTSAAAMPLNTMMWSNFDLFVRYGPRYLDEAEYKRRLREMLCKYYQFLADSFLLRWDRKFWKYHFDGLRQLGHPVNPLRLCAYIIRNAICEPRSMARKFFMSIGLKRQRG